MPSGKALTASPLSVNESRKSLLRTKALCAKILLGRAVWRNWRMDLYKRKRADWVKQSRYTAGNEGFQSFPESNGQAEQKQPGRHLTALERARQKHAAAKSAALKKSESAAKDNKKPGRKERSVATGSNKTEQAGKTSVVAQ